MVVAEMMTLKKSDYWYLVIKPSYKRDAKSCQCEVSEREDFTLELKVKTCSETCLILFKGAADPPQSVE